MISSSSLNEDSSNSDKKTSCRSNEEDKVGWDDGFWSTSVNEGNEMCGRGYKIRVGQI